MRRVEHAPVKVKAVKPASKSAKVAVAIAKTPHALARKSKGKPTKPNRALARGRR